jgi:hypothetical protein
MEAYKRGSHTVWDCKYHPMWVISEDEIESEMRKAA